MKRLQESVPKAAFVELYYVFWNELGSPDETCIVKQKMTHSNVKFSITFVLRIRPLCTLAQIG